MESTPTRIASLTPVDPARPPAPTVGGKRNLAAKLVARINTVPHDLYAEPFVGLGGVFLRRTLRPKTEIINDLDGDVANLFRILQRHITPFMDMLRYQLTSRADFERLNATPAESLTDLERAARFLYLQTLAFGGKRVSRSFGMQRSLGASFDVTRLVPMLNDVHHRLARVIIESLDWRAFIDQYDRESALFYLDPPYAGTEDYYGKGLFSRGDHEALAARLAALKGRFILSINDTPMMREVFSAFEIETTEANWSINGKAQGRRGELIISNVASSAV